MIEGTRGAITCPCSKIYLFRSWFNAVGRGAKECPNFGIGRLVRRVADRHFITGHGQFVDAINLPHQCYGAVVMSPHAHARIAHVDVRSAQINAGAICVLTGADVVADQLGGMPPLFMPDDHGGSPSFRTSRPILVSDRVRCVGDSVAFVGDSELPSALLQGDVHELRRPCVLGSGWRLFARPFRHSSFGKMTYSRDRWSRVHRRSRRRDTRPPQACFAEMQRPALFLLARATFPGGVFCYFSEFKVLFVEIEHKQGDTPFC